MQPYDILMLLVLVGAAAFGAWKGMAWQLASIASVVLSAIVALRFSGLLAPSLSAQEPWNQFLAMGILFAGTSLAVWISFRFVAKIIDRVKLKEFDRQMGALFGAAKGLLYCLILTFFAVTLSEGTRQRVLDSRSGYYAAVIVQKGTPMMPEKVRNALGKYIERLDEGLQQDPATDDAGEESLDANNPLDPMVAAGTGLSLPEPDLTQPASNYLTPLTPQSNGPTLPASNSAYTLDTMKQDAQNFMNQQAQQFGQQVMEAGQNQVNQLGQQVSDSLQQRYQQYSTSAQQQYDQYRTSARQSLEQAQSEVNNGFDAIGRRIQQAPLQPIQ